MFTKYFNDDVRYITGLLAKEYQIQDLEASLKICNLNDQLSFYTILIRLRQNLLKLFVILLQHSNIASGIFELFHNFEIAHR